MEGSSSTVAASQNEESPTTKVEIAHSFPSVKHQLVEQDVMPVKEPNVHEAAGGAMKELFLPSAISEERAAFEGHQERVGETVVHETEEAEGGREGEGEEATKSMFPSFVKVEIEAEVTEKQEWRVHSSRYQVHKGLGLTICKENIICKDNRGALLARPGKPATHLERAASELGTLPRLPFIPSPRVLRSPSCRKKSPIRWFPRKKTESYLERKIRMLQEKEGNFVSLHETLGAANPHLPRIEREKLAAQAAAAKAMAARKRALVEASWCRILKLAGIPCQTAIIDLQKAEKEGAIALTEAANHGVVLGNAPSVSSTRAFTPQKLATCSEAITASLDTAFDVDKEVTVAIKIALNNVELRRHKQEDLELLQQEANMSYAKRDVNGNSDQSLAVPNALESEDHSELELDNQCNQAGLVHLIAKRITDLNDEERISLAATVATHGLTELLKEQTLDQELNVNIAAAMKDSDLGSILLKHVPKFQREIQAAKELTSMENIKPMAVSNSSSSAVAESLDKVLIKHVSKLEKEKLAAAAEKKTSRQQQERKTLDELTNVNLTVERPAITMEKAPQSGMQATDSWNGLASSTQCKSDLGSILVKYTSSLEREKQQALTCPEMSLRRVQSCRPQEDQNGWHAKLEDEKQQQMCPFWSPYAAAAAGKKSLKEKQMEEAWGGVSLGNVLKRHVSRLEREQAVWRRAEEEATAKVRPT